MSYFFNASSTRSRIALERFGTPGWRPRQSSTDRMNSGVATICILGADSGGLGLAGG